MDGVSKVVALKSEPKIRFQQTGREVTQDEFEIAMDPNAYKNLLKPIMESLRGQFCEVHHEPIEVIVEEDIAGGVEVSIESCCDAFAEKIDLLLGGDETVSVD